jgi:tetratricopeptide (TPR) repeat protein
VIDDELLQELLVKATGLYNNGDYRGAIAAWNEALGVDPSSQKAREGIQMATLLLADWDPTAAPSEPPEPATPADGGAPRPSNPEADARRIDEGVKRVRKLLIERKYSEAIDGARGLVPIDPDSEEVQRLVEEAQQAFESAPFIDEHLTLTRELFEQGRRAEAEAECRKVFALDPANPDAHALLAEIQRSAPAPAAAEPEKPSGDSGGRTMRIDRSQLQAFQALSETPGQGKNDAVEATAEAATSADLDFADLPELPDLPESHRDAPVVEAGAHAEADAPEGGGGEPELDLLPDELEIASETAGEAAPASIPAAGDAGEAAFEISDQPASDAIALSPDTPPGTGVPGPGGDAAGTEPPAAPEIFEATTLVPPSVRLVERTPEGQAAIDKLMQQLDDNVEEIESIPLATSAPQPPPIAPVRPAAAAPPAPAKDPKGSASEGGWELELESLNQKSGEHEIVGRSAARTATPPAPHEDLDLTALMGDELGPLQPPPVPEASAPEPEMGIPSRPPAPPPAAPVEAAPAAVKTVAPRPRAQERAARLANFPPAGERRGRSTNSLFALCGVVILIAAAVVWWFFFQPRTAIGRSLPPAAAAPPSASSGADHGTDPGPIPTPIGSTSRQPDPAVARPAPGAGSAEEPAPAGDSNSAPTVPGTAPVPGGAAPTDAAAGAAAPANPLIQPGARSAAPSPAPARARTPEELRAETAQHLAAGKAFIASERWQDARRELAAALSLDPVNFECKQLLEQAQAKVDQETKVRGEYDEAKRLFQDKDYQGALWKLYRLPKDPRYGNLDVPIANAWYNWAVVALKGGDATTAIQKLNEVQQVAPDDPQASKMMEVATQYASRAKDRGFYAFVDTLRFRSFDGK